MSRPPIYNAQSGILHPIGQSTLKSQPRMNDNSRLGHMTTGSQSANKFNFTMHGNAPIEGR